MSLDEADVLGAGLQRDALGGPLRINPHHQRVVVVFYHAGEGEVSLGAEYPARVPFLEFGEGHAIVLERLELGDVVVGGNASKGIHRASQLWLWVLHSHRSLRPWHVFAR